MGASNLIIFFFVTTLTLTGLAHAGSSRQDFLDAHNAVRASVGVGPLSWNETVEAAAQDYMRPEDCRIIASNGTFGENIYKGISGDATDVVNQWVESKQYYDYASNTCDPDRLCDDYTQVVWAKSVNVGCVRMACMDGEKAFIVACEYYPPGNIPGERPY